MCEIFFLLHILGLCSVSSKRGMNYFDKFLLDTRGHHYILKAAHFN